MTDVVPSTSAGAVAPAATAGAVAPAVAGPPVPQIQATGGQVQASLAAESVLDMIRAGLDQLVVEVAHLSEGLGPLQQTADALDLNVINVDELGRLYGAPAATRDANDQASQVATQMADLVGMTRSQAEAVFTMAHQARQDLTGVINIQHAQRVIGAGPRLLASAGR
jgi:hypothetical protein